jgi:hypothetical protein
MKTKKEEYSKDRLSMEKNMAGERCFLLMVPFTKENSRMTK